MSDAVLRKENEALKAQVDALKRQVTDLEKRTRPAPPVADTATDTEINSKALSLVVLGASGDLAKKKTYPVLFRLMAIHKLLPAHTNVIGYARTAMNHEEFRKHIAPNLKGTDEQKQFFLSRCYYFHGPYDSAEAFSALDKSASALEKINFTGANRIFYMAIPPSIFVPVAKSIRTASLSQTGWNRVIVEKPFGKDSESSAALVRDLAVLFDEQQLYRIDHYLGKEIVQNLMALRFANQVFEPIWNRAHIANVQITFKEDIGTEGRGGYFDEFGIIRDVMQNHLIQILSLVAMEPPVSLDAEDIRNEKVKLLRAIPPIVLSDVVLGQYGRDAQGSKQSYLEDTTVPKGSLCPTFATAILHVNNARWKGTPFILKCGKALNERKAEIRLQFHQPANSLYEGVAPDELVLRVQPNEAVYMKLNTKKPGLTNELGISELDLTYKSRFQAELPDAYERLILDVVRGDHNLFVRADELDAAWKIFTPLLHQIEKEKIAPEIYPFGSRGPAAADTLIQRYGYKRVEGYDWPGNSPRL